MNSGKKRRCTLKQLPFDELHSFHIQIEFHSQVKINGMIIKKIEMMKMKYKTKRKINKYCHQPFYLTKPCWWMDFICVFQFFKLFINFQLIFLCTMFQFDERARNWTFLSLELFFLWCTSHYFFTQTNSSQFTTTIAIKHVFQSISNSWNDSLTNRAISFLVSSFFFLLKVVKCVVLR